MSHKVTVYSASGAKLKFDADIIRLHAEDTLATAGLDCRVLYVNSDAVAVLIEPQAAPTEAEG